MPFDNPVIVKGKDPRLITKLILQNGTYEARFEEPPADGYDEVVVNVPGAIAYYSEYNGAQYSETVIIPDITPRYYSYTSPSLYRDCRHLKIFKCLSPDFTSAPSYLLGGSNELQEVFLPYINETGSGGLFAMSNSGGTVQIGSVGHPVIRLTGATFGFGSGGSGWTAKIYVNASTFAEIPANVYNNRPWGAPNLSDYTFYNSNTGEAIVA